MYPFFWPASATGASPAREALRHKAEIGSYEVLCLSRGGTLPPQGSASSGPAGRQMGHSTVLYPGVAQLVARLLWEQDAAGSNPVTRTSPSVHMGTRIFYLAKCRYKHPYQAEPGRNLRSGLGFFFCPFARAYSVQLSFHLDQRQAAAPQS